MTPSLQRLLALLLPRHDRVAGTTSSVRAWALADRVPPELPTGVFEWNPLRLVFELPGTPGLLVSVYPHGAAEFAIAAVTPRDLPRACGQSSLETDRARRRAEVLRRTLGALADDVLLVHSGCFGGSTEAWRWSAGLLGLGRGWRRAPAADQRLLGLLLPPADVRPRA